MFPNGSKFAFTVFDDTDGSTIENVGPVYSFLAKTGFRTTKSVWPLGNVAGAQFAGGTLEDLEYLAFVRDLQRDGFELALHNVRNSHSTRDVVLRGLNEFEERLGNRPRAHTNHCVNRENIYWGTERLSATGVRSLYATATALMRRDRSVFQGHDEQSPYFWGDYCAERVDYVRNFVFDQANVTRMNPTMPYRDPSKPYVKKWFSSCDGARVESFCRAISEQAQDELHASGGVCIMYTHFAKGFATNGALHPRFKQLMERFAKLGGWYVPVSTLLDYLGEQNGEREIGAAELARMERNWLLSKLRTGTT